MLPAMNAVDLGPLAARVRLLAGTLARLRDAYGLAVLGVHDRHHAEAAPEHRDAIWFDLKCADGELEAAKRRLRMACADCLVRSERTGWRMYCEGHGWAGDAD